MKLIHKIPCQYCKSENTRVTDSRRIPNGTRRRCGCDSCHKRFTVYEKKGNREFVYDLPCRRVRPEHKFMPQPAPALVSAPVYPPADKHRLFKTEVETIALRMSGLLREAAYGCLSSEQYSDVYRTLNEWDELKRKILS